jgi:hypothetical protein
MRENSRIARQSEKKQLWGIWREYDVKESQIPEKTEEIEPQGIHHRRINLNGGGSDKPQILTNDERKNRFYEKN